MPVPRALHVLRFNPAVTCPQVARIVQVAAVDAARREQAAAAGEHGDVHLHEHGQAVDQSDPTHTGGSSTGSVVLLRQRRSAGDVEPRRSEPVRDLRL